VFFVGCISNADASSNANTYPCSCAVATVTYPQSGFMEDDGKQQMAESFAAQSGTNVAWSRK
jgi:hypothetical protein